jgi:hypothetical protein
MLGHVILIAMYALVVAGTLAVLADPVRAFTPQIDHLL